MNNYPPGVSESNIPGWNNFDLEIYVECMSKNKSIKVIDVQDAIVVSQWIKQLLSREINEPNSTDLVRALERVEQLINILNYKCTVNVDNCPFKGDVDASSDGETLFWQCPMCDTEHEDKYQYSDYS